MRWHVTPCIVLAHAAVYRISVERFADILDVDVELGFMGPPDYRFDSVSQMLEEPGPINSTSVEKHLRNYDDVMYTINLNIGTPPRTFKFVLDTGSADMWLKYKDFNVSGSSTGRYLHVHPISLLYGVGRAWGQVVDDKVCFKSLTHCIQQQTFMLCHNTGIGNNNHFDGVLGLAFPSMAHNRHGSPFLESLTKCCYPNLAFGMAFDWSRKQDSFIAFGNIKDVIRLINETGDCSENISLHVYMPPMWRVRGVLQVSGLEYRIPLVIDSGSSLIIIPSGMFNPLLFSVISKEDYQSHCRNFGHHGIVCHCDAVTVNTLNIKLRGVGGAEMTVDLNSDDLLVPVRVRSGAKGYCRLGLMEAAWWIPDILLGDTFLRRVYTVLDPTQHAVWLAKRKRTGPSGRGASRIGAHDIGRWITWSALGICCFVCVRIFKRERDRHFESVEPLLTRPEDVKP